MQTVRYLLDKKGSAIWSVTPETPVLEALELMAEKDIGALLVLENKQIAGIFSERDYARKLISIGERCIDIPIREAMTTSVITVQSTQSLRDCMKIMSHECIRHLPVLEDDTLVGIISLKDLLQAVIDDPENDCPESAPIV
jgi:CBS domain-containing protein